ncbi:hypothetical protein [Streptococcus nidrosiense]|uniref:hypothetical protein n=1 Tax=Streptococcus nidrosiense TaxID=3140788 RepID=UPI0035CF8450
MPSYASCSFAGSKVTLVSLSLAVFWKVCPAKVKVTRAPGVTFVTTIERCGKPPVSFVEPTEIAGACGFTLIVTSTVLLLPGAPP